MSETPNEFDAHERNNNAADVSSTPVEGSNEPSLSSAAEDRPSSVSLPAPSSTLLSSSPVEVDGRINYEKPLLQRIGSLVESGELTDVKFLIGEKKVEMRAHKLILALSSPVFTSMFYSPYESQNVIEIPDCQPEAFQAMIQFIYTGERLPMIMDVTLALSTLYAARKYAVKGLEDSCIRILTSSITPDNVFEILETADFYSLAVLERDAWEFIEAKTAQVIRTHKKELGQETIISILKNHRLAIKEIDLFEILMEWSEEKCRQENLSLTPENKLAVCREAISFIRFPTMKSSEFANKVVPTGILDVEQVAKIFTFISSGVEQRESLLMDWPTVKREPKVSFAIAATATHNNQGIINVASLLQNNGLQRLLNDAREVDLAIQVEDIQFINGPDEVPANLPAGRGRRGSRRSRRRHNPNNR